LESTKTETPSAVVQPESKAKGQFALVLVAVLFMKVAQ
jgi:hypothetical protein